jgi:dipeptidyl-peptidase-4
MHLRSFGCLFFAALTLAPAILSAEPTPLHKANYDLAAKWTSQKVSKRLFDTSVAPHWLDSGDRFWYTYATSQGRKYWLVDCRAKTKKPLFDGARMAAMLTRITLSPYDAQHLPIRTVKFIKKDMALLFEIDLSKDATVRVGDQFKTVQEISDEAVKSDDMQDKSKEKQTDKNIDKQQGKTDTKTDVKTDKGTDQKTDGDIGGKTDTKTTLGTGKTNTQTGGKAQAAGDAAATTKTLFFEYDLKTDQLTLLPTFKAPPKKMLWASVSPDEKTVVFARGHNLFMMDAANYALAQKKADDKAIKETQLTTDGELYDSYARTLKEENKKVYQTQEKDRKDYRVPAIGIAWSKDSKKFAVERNDERKVGDLWVINSLSQPRPTLETYRYGMPGEENQPQAEVRICDVAARTWVKVKADKFKDQTVGIASDRVLSTEREQDKVVDKWLSDTSDKLYFERASRDRHKLDVCVADTATGDVKTLIEERLNTYIDTQPLRLVNGGKEMLFWSERDGWGHYYLYDADGKLENQVTSGEFTCEGIAGIDSKSRTLTFNACGREPDEDPYFTHLYRVRLDGKDLKLVDPGAANHATAMNDDAHYFVDNVSRADAAPHSDLRDANGALVADLETTDLSALLDSGFKFPEPFKVKADDGITDLYGVMYKPFDFDPNKRYPVIEYVYPGPQTESVSKVFSPRNPNVALAQMGFIVLEVGNRGGSPQRSKWYHNFGYGNLRDYGLADKKHAVEELALKYPWLDTDRVGIYGHSGGGFMSAAAILVYPDFYKVAFSESGNHENNIYNRWWSESHHGVKENTDKDGKTTFAYDIDKNSDIAKNLKGHLMLVTGDIDDNVHPANTVRLANALIRANKRFDYFQFPGQRHGYGDMSDYCFWMRADYFCKYLLGDSASGADILQLDREQPQTGDRRVRSPDTPDVEAQSGEEETE